MDNPDAVEIVPLTVVARSFAARPSSLPEVRDFVRRQLTGTAVTDDDVRRLCDHVAEVLLEAAGVSGSIQVSLRIFPAAAEVDVLFAAERTAPAPGRTAAIPDPPTGRTAPTPGPPTGRTAPTPGPPTGRTAAAGAPTSPSAGPIDPVDAGRHPGGPVTDAVSISPAAPEAALSFAKWFSARLRREGLTMEAAARRLDVSAKTISRWVAGSTEPRLRDLLRIREIFGEPPIH